MAKPRKNRNAYVEGADELDAVLKKLGDRTTGLLLREAAEEGAKILAAEAKRLAPRDKGDLAEGVAAEVHRLQQGRAQFNVGYSKNTWYGRLVEMGTEKMPAQPFLRPAFEAKGQEAADAVEKALRDILREFL